jgi:hypothetical protein
MTSLCDIMKKLGALAKRLDFEESGADKEHFRKGEKVWRTDLY